MLDEIKQVLSREGIRTAAIIDDVYDETPTPADIEREQWDFFETDLTEMEVDLIIQELKIDDVYAALPQLKLDRDFIEFVWRRRGNSDVFGALFKSFEHRQISGRKTLAPLKDLLTELGLGPRTGGVRELDSAQDAELIFLDLFLGPRQDEDARMRTVDRVRGIIERRRATPPLVVLMSSSTRLGELRDLCRDEGTLLGCQFRTFQKLDITDTERLHELIYRLVCRYRDTLRLAAFIQVWRQALESAAERFLTRVRRLDLRDYADIQELVLKSQDENVGTYLLEAYDQFFHYELEGDAELRAAGRDIDQIAWADYPPPHFLPEAVGGDIVDGLLFHHPDVVSPDDPIGFGDVLFGAKVDAWPSHLEPKVKFETGERLALMVLTQACDIQQGNAKTMLFMAGVARPAALDFHKRPEALLTPTIVVGTIRYVLDWEPRAPIAWSPLELGAKLSAGDYRRVRRFRPLHAVQLQQCFVGALSRVGTPVMLPPQHVVAVELSYRDKEGTVHRLTGSLVDERQAIAMVGRDKKRHTDHVVLSSQLVDQLREAMRKVDPNTLADKVRARWEAAVVSREFFLRLEQGIVYERNASQRSLIGTSFDIIQVVGPYVIKGRPIVGGKHNDTGPLFIALSVAAIDGTAVSDDSSTAEK